MTFDEFAEAGGDVSRETFDRLALFADLLIRWNTRINLVAPSTIPDLWQRHILDSLQLLRIAPEGAAHWVDLGSGGGLPGIVVAADTQDDARRFTLVESDQRKATFLRTAIRELGLNAKVIARRIEDIAPLQADVISARALAPLADLLGFHQRHGAAHTVGLYLKGATADAEVASALERWTFTCQKVPSATSANSLVLNIGDVHRA